MLDITSIPSSRVPFIDARTGMISREWYRFLVNQFQLTGNGSNTASITDLQLGPQSQDTSAIVQALEDIGVQPGPGVAIENQDALLLPQPQLGTMAAENTDNLRMIGFATSPSPAIPTAPNVGSAWWDGGTTLDLRMTNNVTQPVGEAIFTYVKATAAITKGNLVKITGVSVVPTAAPTSTSMTNQNDVVAVAAEDIALNGFGLVQNVGVLSGFDTTGSSVGETWADGDALYYNPAYAGSFTNVLPSAPNLKIYAGQVIDAAASGSIMIRFVYGSTLGATDSSVQITSVADKNLLQYDSGAGYWKNVAKPTLTATLGVGGATASSSGAGVSFPATQSASSDANTLDDYEEGTWTPTITGSVSNPSVTYSQRGGEYVKVGQFVQCSAYVEWTAFSGGSGDIYISLPFSCLGGSIYVSGSVGVFEGLTMPAGRTAPGVQSFAGWQYIRIVCMGSAVSTAVLNVSSAAASGGLGFSLCYRATA